MRMNRTRPSASRLSLALTITLVAAAGLMGCATDPTTSPRAGERYAIIETGASRKADHIFPVLISRLNDTRISITADDLSRGRGGHFPRARHVFKVTPGTHTIHAMGLVDRNMVPGLSVDLSRDNNEPLTHNFQSGTRYFIGLKADSARRADWELVIWKTEKIEAGTLDLGQN